MALINVKTREVQIKIVYYGPGRGGKTTNLEYINNKYKDQIKTEMVSLNTQDDRTLFFDFLPFDVGQIKGFDTTIQLYTVPGQAKYNATRRLVLRGVDGIVFVADVQKEQRKKNIESLNQLYENLETYNLDLFKMPLVMQYNKIDLRLKLLDTSIISSEDMQKDLNNLLRAPAFEASALKGGNVTQTLKKIISMTLASIQDQL
ncbi:MAG: GTPase domain-containing protein [Desulfobacteraceae bacterium]|nr:GTPase domain-containing protein [Desulfobacteraceae bacterium]